MTLGLSRLKDGDEAESFKIRNLDDSKDSEEDNVQPITVDDHNGYSSKESNSSGEGEEGSISHTQYYDAKSKETSRMNLPKQRVWSKDHSWHLVLGDPDE